MEPENAKENKTVRIVSAAQLKTIPKELEPGSRSTTPKVPKGDEVSGLGLRRVTSEFIIFSDEDDTAEEETKKRERHESDASNLISITENEEEGQDYDIRIRGPGKSELQATGSGILQHTKQMERGDLEIWWVNSPVWRRIIPVMCIILFILTIVNACAAIYFFTAEEKGGKDFEVCRTQGCKDIANWIKEGLDESFDPCENFYRFTCNKYSHPTETPDDIPSSLKFDVAKFQLNAEGVLAGSLKPSTDDPNGILIAFYKSCLDTKRRKQTELESLAQIINQTLPLLFVDSASAGPKEIVVPATARSIALATGHLGFFGYQLLVFPNVALIPPDPWIVKLANPDAASTAKVTKDLENAYTALWAMLEKYFRKPSPTVADAVSRTMKALQFISSPKTASTAASGEAAITTAGKMIGSILGRQRVLVRINVTERYFGGDELQSFNAFLEKSNIDDLLPFWLLCLLEVYSDELTTESRALLKLQPIFSHNTEQFRLQDLSLERFCFESFADQLNGFSNHQFVHSLRDTKLLANRMTKSFREARRAMRYIYFDEKLAENLKPYDNIVLKEFMNPFNNIVLNFPFPYDEESSNFFNELQSYYLSFRPGPNYLFNILETSIRQNEGEVKSWEKNRIDQKRRQTFDLEHFRTEIDNAVKYENNIYPPMVLFDRPLFLNDMRVFDHAGAILFLIRNFLALWKKNLDDPGPLMYAFYGSDYPDLVKSTFGLTNEIGENCELNQKTISIQEFLEGGMSKDSLALIISLQLFRNATEFLDRVYVKNGTLAEGVEPLYHPNSRRFVRVVKNNNGSLVYEFLDEAEFGAVHTERFKFQFRKAPNGLEHFTEEQLFFLAAIRHHCFAPHERDKSYVSNVNEVLKHVAQFGEAWECPLGSPMNPPNKCLQ